MHCSLKTYKKHRYDMRHHPRMPGILRGCQPNMTKVYSDLQPVERLTEHSKSLAPREALSRTRHSVGPELAPKVREVQLRFVGWLDDVRFATMVFRVYNKAH